MQTGSEITGGHDQPAYKRTSRRATVGIVLAIVIFAGLLFLGFNALMDMFRDSDAYKLGYARLEADPRAMSVLGPPLVTRIVMGSISTSGDSGKARLNVEVTGSKAKGTMSIVAEKTMGQWAINRETLKLDGDDKLMDIEAQPSGQ